MPMRLAFVYICTYILCVLGDDENAIVMDASVKNFTSEMNALFEIVHDQIAFIDEQNPKIMKMINASGDIGKYLLDAKNKAIKNEQAILESVMFLSTMDDFLKNIILVENLFNSLYTAEHSAMQKKARAQFAPNITKYEKMPRPECNVDTFVGLMFYAKTDFPSFEKWVASIGEECKAQNINVWENSGAVEKTVDQSFYKAYYVYAAEFGDKGFQKMADVLRATLVFDDWDALYRAFTLIEKMAKPHGGILRAKDRYNPKYMPVGYRDLLINVNCPDSPIPLVCEIQLHHKIFYKYKEVSHKMYEIGMNILNFYTFVCIILIARIFEVNGVNLAYQFADKHMRKIVGNKMYKVCEKMCANPHDLLKKWGLGQYADALIEKEGWDDVSLWNKITSDDLKQMGFKHGHAAKFIKYVSEKTISSHRRLTENENEASSAMTTALSIAWQFGILALIMYLVHFIALYQ